MRFSVPIFRLKREARGLARRRAIALHLALDEIARREGFKSWNHLASSSAAQGPAARMLSAIDPGDLLVLAARPGQGKTVLGLEILAEALAIGRQAIFFSSECTREETGRLLIECGRPGAAGRICQELVDNVCARQIQARLCATGAGTVAVVDYLQIMDQHRSEPPIGLQIAQLKELAAARGVSLVFLSQVHKSFDPGTKSLPDFSDLRVVNPLDHSLFNKGCFLHGGVLSLVSH